MIEITIGIPEDIPSCLTIRSAAFRNQAIKAYTQEEVARLVERDESDRMLRMVTARQLFVAKDQGVLVGLGGWNGQNIFNLYVAPSHMRRGIGSKLLARIEGQFKERSSSNLICVDAGVYTRPFYESNGYVVMSQPTSTDGLVYLEMQKHLR